MSKLNELMSKLDRLEQRKKELTMEVDCVKDEIDNVKTMLDIINEVIEERKSAAEEAMATLITKRNQEGKITDSDFLEFGEAADISLSGLIDEPAPDIEQETAQVA